MTPLHQQPEPPLLLCSTCWLGLCPVETSSQSIVALFEYDGPLASAVSRLKYQRDLAVARTLGQLLSRAPLLSEPWDGIVPVPLHWRRRLARGFNHVEELLRVGLDSRFHRVRPLLRRVRATPPQVSLLANHRHPNVAGAFAIRKRDLSKIRGRRFLVVDDVTTTGATLQACLQTLMQHGAQDARGLALLQAVA